MACDFTKKNRSYTNNKPETRKLVPCTEIRYRDTGLSKVTNRHAAWITPHGRVQASFWTVSNDSNAKTRGDATRTADKTVAARLAIAPNSIGTSPFRVVFDFAPHLDPSATITYQAMIPNDSEVFRIAGSGEVKELIELLKKGTASITDRDEEGRSLLNVSCYRPFFGSANPESSMRLLIRILICASF